MQSRIKKGQYLKIEGLQGDLHQAFEELVG
jgi:hypothetical protein